MNEKEKFLFDLQGFLVLEDVLSAAEVKLANEALARHEDLIVNRDPGLSEEAQPLKGETGRGELRQNPLTFERPWCEPFRWMLCHPRLIDLFNEVLGTGFRIYKTMRRLI